MDERRQRLYRTEAIVLKRRDYGEADRILTVFTPDFGKLTLLAKGVRKTRSRKAGHVELFTDSTMLVAKGRTWDLVSQAEMIEPFRALHEDLQRTSYAFYIAELLDGFTQERDPHPQIFALLKETLSRLAASKDEVLPLVARFFDLRLLSQMGYPRLHSTPDGYFLGEHLWHLLIRRISQEYHKRQRDVDPAHAVTTLVEFARGVEHGGFRSAFEHLSAELASHAAILYLNVSFSESLRKNRRRFNPDRPDSILEHGLSDEKMERLYKENDWMQITSGASQGYLPIQGAQVPFVVFENEDDVTTPGGEPLGQRLEDSLGRLWELVIRR